MPRPVITSPQRKIRNDIIEFTPAAAASQRGFHSIVGDSHFDVALGGDGAELRRHLAFVACHNFRSAMSDDCARNAFFLAPCELGPNWRVADECFAAPPNKRARDRGAIANVDL